MESTEIIYSIWSCLLCPPPLLWAFVQVLLKIIFMMRAIHFIVLQVCFILFFKVSFYWLSTVMEVIVNFTDDPERIEVMYPWLLDRWVDVVIVVVVVVYWDRGCCYCCCQFCRCCCFFWSGLLLLWMIWFLVPNSILSSSTSMMH